MIGSLGTVTSDGSPTRITANASAQVQAAQRMGATSVRLQALSDNEGIITVGLLDDTSSPVVLVPLGLIGKPASADGPFDVFEMTLADLPQGIDLYSIFIQAESDGDGVIVAYTAN